MCFACRAVGLLHCSDPINCGEMDRMTDIQKYASQSVEEYPEITEEWRKLRLRGFIEQAYRFGLEDGLEFTQFRSIVAL